MTPEILNQINSKNKRQALKRHLNDDEKILDQNSRSVQTWSNVPRFHQDIINGKSFQKKKKQEKLDRVLKKKG